MKTRLTITAALATMLSSISLHPLFLGTGWIWSGLGAIIVVALTGLLTRRVQLPAIVCLAAGLAALSLYLTVVYAGDKALLGVIPTPSSVAKLASLMGEGLRTANKYAAPVPLRKGVWLLAVLGIGLVAVVVDFLAVRLRWTAPAGLPLLAMCSLPAAVREGNVGWLAFLLGAAGFMALLLADAREQVSRWGRQVHASRRAKEAPRVRLQRGGGERADFSALTGSGRRIGLAALALALVVPTLVPSIGPTGLFGLGGGSGPGNATNLVTTPDALVSMRRQLLRPGREVVLTYQTNDPDREPEYLRMFSLDRFDGSSWTKSQLSSTAKDRVQDRRLPPPAGLGPAMARRAVTTRVTIGKQTRDVTFLPLPYAPQRVNIEGDWRVNASSLMVFSAKDTADGRTYTATGVRALPTSGQLQAAGKAPSSIQERYGALPPDLPKKILTTAQSVTSHARDQYQQALALEDWFQRTGGFTYRLDAPRPANFSDLEDFLFVHKQGYCEQFAASMALMARELGIPSRVAVGYTQGRLEGDRWVVRSSDAHAWPELYFDGVGWLRFEPTPGGADGQGSASVPSYAQPPVLTPQPGFGGQATTAPLAPVDPGAAGAPGAGVRGHRFNESGGAGTAGQGPGSVLPFGWITAGFLLVILLAAPMGIRLATRYRRWARASFPIRRSGSPAEGDPPQGSQSGETGPDGALAAQTAHAAWAELRADAIDHGLPWRASDSPRSTAHRLTELLELGGGAVAALERISHAEERARYAPTPAPADALRADVQTMREAFAAGVSRAARTRARFVPPTAMASVRTAGAQALETLDRQAARLRDRFRGARSAGLADRFRRTRVR